MAPTTLDVMTPEWVGSPNFAAGRRGHRPLAIVIHIAEGHVASVDSWFRSMQSKVSAHYLVTQAGKLRQYVREEDTAWHTGLVRNPTWTGLKRDAAGAIVNPNLYTIGVEHEGLATAAWSASMYARSAMLLAELHVRWGIPLDRSHVVGHREIRADKTCPGFVVDLNRLVAMGRALVHLP